MKAAPTIKQVRNHLTRREFIRYSSLALSGMAIPAVTGCASFRPRQTCLDQIERGIMRSYHIVFKPAQIGSIRLRNRIIRSATSLGKAKIDGSPSPELSDTYIELCRGGIGAIITDAAAIDRRGCWHQPNLLRFDKNELITPYKELIKRIHRYNTPIILQIGHAGRQTRRRATGAVPVAPSPIRDSYYNEDTPHELTDNEILDIIEKFVDAIVRAQKAEFDGVQLHAAHGYLLSAFLSPATNKRRDQWGGSVENRFRIIKEIYENARKQVGDFPIWIKLNAYDNQPDGLRVDETLKIAVMLQNIGCDAIEVSCGIINDGFSTIRVYKIPSEAILKYSFKYKNSPEIFKTVFPTFAPLLVNRSEPVLNYNVCAAQEIKQAVDIPIIVVGGIRKLPHIEQIIGGKMADFVALSRPLIAEPDIVKNFRAKRRMESECTSCGYCIMALSQMPVQCLKGSLI